MNVYLQKYTIVFPAGATGKKISKDTFSVLWPARGSRQKSRVKTKRENPPSSFTPLTSELSRDPGFPWPAHGLFHFGKHRGRNGSDKLFQVENKALFCKAFGKPYTPLYFYKYRHSGLERAQCPRTYVCQRKGQIAKKGGRVWNSCRGISLLHSWEVFWSFEVLEQTRWNCVFHKKRERKKTRLRKLQHSIFHAQKGNKKNAPGYVNAFWFVLTDCPLLPGPIGK